MQSRWSAGFQVSSKRTLRSWLSAWRMRLLSGAWATLRLRIQGFPEFWITRRVESSFGIRNIGAFESSLFSGFSSGLPETIHVRTVFVHVHWDCPGRCKTALDSGWFRKSESNE